METETFLVPGEFGVSLSEADLTLVLVGAVLLRLLPVLIGIGALVKLRLFPEHRALHILLLVEVGLLAALAAIDRFAPEIVPRTVRDGSLWSFLWIFAIAWVAVTWVRSAVKTRMRPRWMDGATLLCALALALAALGVLLPGGAAP